MITNIESKNPSIPLNTKILNVLDEEFLFTLSYFNDWLRLEEINVTESHWYYKSIDGILYSKDGTRLIKCPLNKTGTIVIPEGVISIEPSAFTYCKLSKVVFPDSLRNIGFNAFFKCPNLEEIEFGTGITSIGNERNTRIFASCNELKEINFPKQLKEIHYAAFFDCQNLKKIELNDGLILIGSSAFEACSCLSEVKIPKSVIRIGNKAFTTVKNVYVQKYIPNLVSSVCAIYSYRSDVVTIHIGNDDFSDEIIVPAHAKEEESIKRMEVAFRTSYGTESFGLNFHEEAFHTQTKQDIALKMYKKTKAESLAKYLRRTGKFIAKSMISNGKEKDFIDFLDLNLLSESALKDIYEMVSDNAVLKSYIMGKINKSNKSGFAL